MVQANQRLKRNLRDKRRSTGIRPNDVSLASTSAEVYALAPIERAAEQLGVGSQGSTNDDELADDECSNATSVAGSSDSLDRNRNVRNRI